MGRSNKKSQDFDFSIEIEIAYARFYADINANNLEYAASLTYFFVVLYAYLSGSVERTLGIVLVLSAIIIVWYVRNERKEIKSKYLRRLEHLKGKN